MYRENIATVLGKYFKVNGKCYKSSGKVLEIIWKLPMKVLIKYMESTKKVTGKHWEVPDAYWEITENDTGTYREIH